MPAGSATSRAGSPGAADERNGRRGPRDASRGPGGLRMPRRGLRRAWAQPWSARSRLQEAQRSRLESGGGCAGGLAAVRGESVSDRRRRCDHGEIV